LPEKGKILDAGCGHGLLALVLALQSPRRFVFGVDHDRARVRAARRAGHGLANLRVERGDYTRLPGGTYDGMVFMDVLHYLPFRAQESLLRRAHKKLKRRGRLVFREVAAGGGFFSGWNKIHENLMTRLGFTQAEELHFRDAEGWRQCARKAGFRVRSKPLARPPFADHLFECDKR
jgi:2-polyprenyl-6-hydroxyphenyl methylase/3-demethylubiquinone-9 3-methyltransferase